MPMRRKPIHCFSRRVVMMTSVNTHRPTNRTLAVIKRWIECRSGRSQGINAAEAEIARPSPRGDRMRHYSPKTEDSYVHWIKRFIFFHNKRHPAEMAEPEIARFLSNLATGLRVSGSTQNQALNALLFLYHQVLGKEIGYVNGV